MSRMAELEKAAVGLADDSAELHRLRRHALRILRLTWRASWSWGPADFMAADKYRGERDAPTSPVVRKSHDKAACSVCAQEAGYRAANLALKLPRLGAVVVCVKHWPEALAEGQRRLAAKYPQTEWRLSA